jgi:hypothetical protein
MKFTELTQEQINNIKKIYTNKSLSWDDRMTQLTELTGMCERTVRTWCSKKLKLKERIEVESEQYEQAKKRKVDKTKKRFIITWAQNNTPVHSKFFANIEAYAKFIDADIHVIAGRYKNPTSVFTDEEEDFWVEEVLPYLDANRHDIHKYLSVMSDVKIQPTATNPMSGLHAMSGINSCIFGSPKVQLEMIPVLEGNKPKMMLTTGACTLINYTDSKSGKKGEFHHTLGFAVVEIKDKDTFFVRQVTAHNKNASFSDLYFNVNDGVITRLKTIAGIVLGDLHAGHHDQKLINKTHDLLQKLVPETVVLHDVFDGSSINPHEAKDPFLQYGKEVQGTNSVEKEIRDMMKLLKGFEKYQKVVIDRSNHDDFLDRWLKNEDWKRQSTAKNSMVYMEYSAILLKQYAESPYNVKGVIPALINREYPVFITLSRTQSYKIGDWEVGQHGDKGFNGSRGSLIQFRKLNTKIIVGHYHSCGRKDGTLSVGTSTHLRVGYNDGPSSWAQAHVIIHKDGKAQHIIFQKDGKGELGYTTLE